MARSAVGLVDENVGARRPCADRSEQLVGANDKSYCLLAIQNANFQNNLTIISNEINLSSTAHVIGGI